MWTSINLCGQNYKKLTTWKCEICLQERANAPCGHMWTSCGKKTLYRGRANAPCGHHVDKSVFRKNILMLKILFTGKG